MARMDMILVRLRGDARVGMRAQARQALRAHCGCLSGGETMPVDDSGTQQVANVDRVH
jgi:hypothetical protein